MHGETLSSWLSRGVNANQDSNLSLAYQIHRDSPLHEKDFNVKDSLMSMISSVLGLDSKILNSIFKPPSCWLIDNPKQRIYFCTKCLSGQYISTGKLVVMSCWSNCWYTICYRHHCALTEISSCADPEAAKVEALLIGLTEGDLHEPIHFGARSDFLKGQACFNFGALKFQQWCWQCLSGEKNITNSWRGSVSSVQFKIFLVDVLSIIMRKRFWERDVKTYLSILLQRSSWNSFNCSCYGNVFTDLVKPEFCVHSIRARIVAFALMALILDVPGGLTAWRMIPACLKIDDHSLTGWDSKEAVWNYILASEIYDFREWLKTRALDWHPVLKKRYSYLI
jgi:hypothetical protein